MNFSRAMRPVAACLAATCLAGSGLALATPAFAQAAQVELTEEQSATLEQMKAEAGEIDKIADPRAYQAAYREIVEYASTIYPPDHPEVVILEGEVDFGYFMLGQIDRLPERMIRARQVFLDAGPAYRTNYVETVNNLGVVYQALGLTDQAITYQQEAVALGREDAPPEGNALLVQALNNLAWTMRGAGDLDMALEFSAEALALADPLMAAEPDNTDLADAYATTINNRAIYYLIRGQLDEAGELLRQGIVRVSAVFGAEHPRVGTLMLNGSNLLLQTGQHVAAEDMARRALEIRENAYGPESPTAAEARLNLIAALTSQNRFEDALPLAEYTTRVLTENQGADAPPTLEARAKLTNIYMAMGRIEEAVNQAEQLVAMFRTNRPAGHHDTEYFLYRLAIDYGRLGRWAEALPVLAELETSYEGTGDEYLPAYAQMLALRALAEVKAGSPESARAYLERAKPQLVSYWRAEVESEGAQGGNNRVMDWAFGWATAAARELGDTGQAFELAQYIGIGPSERSLLRARQRDAAGDAGVAAALRARQDLVEQRETAMGRFQDAANSGDAEALGTLGAQIEALSGEIAGFDLADAPLLQPEEVADLQSRIAPDAALLFIVESDIGTQLFAVTDSGVAADVASASTLQLREMVDTLRASIEAGIASGADYDSGTAMALHDALFTPAIRSALQGRETISVIARGKLARLPFSILMGRDGHFALEHHAFAYPIDMAGVGRTDGAGSAQVASFFGIGAPALPEPEPVQLAFRGADNAMRVAGLGRLGLAEGELRAMADAMQAESTLILTGDEATEQHMRAQDLAHAQFITFATHGLMAGELEGLDEAALVLSPPLGSEAEGPLNDGLLTASEIAALDLDARWVVLSACNSASGNGQDDEAFGGLAQAFLYAGADSLLASHWRVRDDAAARLTVATAQGTAAGLSPAQALRQAKLDLMHDASVPMGSHPAIWAPFVFVGS